MVSFLTFCNKLYKTLLKVKKHMYELAYKIFYVYLPVLIPEEVVSSAAEWSLPSGGECVTILMR